MNQNLLWIRSIRKINTPKSIFLIGSDWLGPTNSEPMVLLRIDSNLHIILTSAESCVSKLIHLYIRYSFIHSPVRHGVFTRADPDIPGVSACSVESWVMCCGCAARLFGLLVTFYKANQLLEHIARIVRNSRPGSMYIYISYYWSS